MKKQPNYRVEESSSVKITYSRPTRNRVDDTVENHNLNMSQLIYELTRPVSCICLDHTVFGAVIQIDFIMHGLCHWDFRSPFNSSYSVIQACEEHKRST